MGVRHCRYRDWPWGGCARYLSGITVPRSENFPPGIHRSLRSRDDLLADEGAAHPSMTSCSAAERKTVSDRQVIVVSCAMAEGEVITTTALVRHCSTRIFSTKSFGHCRRLVSKGRTYSTSTPSRSNRMRLHSRSVRMFGACWGAKKRRGLGSITITAGLPPMARASSMRAPMMAW